MIFKKNNQFIPEKTQGDVLGRIPEVIFDVGAYNGDGISQYRKLYPFASIYGFEPIKELNEKMIDRFYYDKHIYLFDCALGEKRGTRLFYKNKSPDTSSLFRTSIRAGEYTNSNVLENDKVINVQVETLDTICLNRNVKSIDILKIDVQGGELLVLNGAKDMLSGKRIAVIYLEFIIVPLYVGQTTMSDICSYLSSFGYALQGLYDLTLEKNGSVKWGNAIFKVGEQR